MQTGFDQVVDPHIAPTGQELSPQAVEVIRRVLARMLLDLLQGVADALQAVPHRARKDGVQQQKAGHGGRADRVLHALAVHLISPRCAQQGDPLQFIQHAAHLLRGGQQQEIFDVEDAGGFVGPFDQTPQLTEQPTQITAQGGVGDPVHELAAAADDPQLLLHRFPPDVFVVLQAPVQIIDLLPHLRGDHIPDLPCVFPRHRNATHDAVGIAAVQQQEAHHLFGRGTGVGPIEAVAIPRHLHQRQPRFGAARRTVQCHRFTHLQKARDVFGAFQIAVDPVERIGNATQHGTASWACGAAIVWSSTIQVSLQPPPWDEFTTSEPRLRATRVSPPGLTQLLAPRST